MTPKAWRPSNGGRKVIGLYPTPKADEPIWWESQVERDFLYCADFYPDIVKIKRYIPKEKVKYKLGPKWHSYTADYWLVFRDGSICVIEVKTEKQALKDKCQTLFRAVRPIFEGKGFKYRVVLDKEIRKYPRLENIQLLHRYSRVVITVNVQTICMKMFEVDKAIRIKEAISILEDYGISPPVLYGMIWHGVFDVDINLPVSKESFIWFTGELNPRITGE